MITKRPKLPASRIKSLRYRVKGEGEPCKQGETSTQSGCVPAEGEVKQRLDAATELSGETQRKNDGERNNHLQNINRRLQKNLEKSGLSDESKKVCLGMVEKLFGRMNETALKRISFNTLRYNFHKNADELTTEVKKRYPKLAERLADQPSAVVNGLYSTMNQNLHLPVEGEWVDGTAAHELTHAIDGPSMEISKSQEWQDAWAYESAELGVYAEENTQEGLAEFGRLVFYEEQDKAKIEKQYPKMVAVWKKFGIW